MRFNVEDLNPGVWIDLDPDEPKMGRVCLRVLDLNTNERLRAKHTKKETSWDKHQKVTEEVLDDAAWLRDVWDEALVGWDGILDAEGKDIPCERDWKIKLLTGNPLFLDLYTACIDKIRGLNREQAAAEAKNS